jgi:uncharacterized protein (TIGR02271 family)
MKSDTAMKTGDGMITTQELQSIYGAEVYGPGNEKIGSAGQIYLDDESGQPEWVTVRTGLFGTKESFIPLADARWIDDHLEVPYDKSRVKDAPRVDSDAHIEPGEEEQLYAYYGLTGDRYGNMRDDRSDAAGVSAGQAGVNAGRGADFDALDKGRNTRSDDAMTRSEERLRAGTRNEAVGKVRLRKYVVTEQQQVTVPVTREEARIEREPITDANRDDAMSGPEITEAEHEVTLHAERPVVETEAVPVERVRLDTDTVTEQETVAADVRKEHIEVESDSAAGLADDDSRTIR